MRYKNVMPAVIGAAVLITASSILAPPAAQASRSIVPCNEAALIKAIGKANDDGGGTVVLSAGCTYTLTTAHDNDVMHGPVGLPIINMPVTIEGNHTTITRSRTAAPFRLAMVRPTGHLTLKAITLSGGHAAQPEHDDGGAILNFGEATLTNSTLSGNTADGLGGGLYSEGPAASTTITASMIKSNVAHQGGGIASAGAEFTITGSAVDDNSAEEKPGGIYYVAGAARLGRSTINANTPTNCTSSPSRVPGCMG